MIDSIKIERTKTAPRPMYSKGVRTSKWRALFGTMKVGDWFVIGKSDYGKAGNAGQLYLKGKYSLYRHPEKDSSYIFLRNK